MADPRLYHGNDGYSLLDLGAEYVLWHHGSDRFGVIAAFACPTGYTPAPEGPHVLPGGGRLCRLDGAMLYVTSSEPGGARQWKLLRDFDTWGR